MAVKSAEEIEKILKAIDEDDPDGDDEELQNYREALRWAQDRDDDRSAEEFISYYIRSK